MLCVCACVLSLPLDKHYVGQTTSNMTRRAIGVSRRGATHRKNTYNTVYELDVDSDHTGRQSWYSWLL